MVRDSFQKVRVGRGRRGIAGEQGEPELESAAAASAAEGEETADSASYIAGGGCNIILVTGNGIKHEDYEEDSYYATSNNCSETSSTDSDIDFSDLEEEHPALFSTYDVWTTSALLRISGESLTR